MSRRIVDAKDRKTGQLIYFKGHAAATYMSDGTSIEDFAQLVREYLDNLAENVRNYPIATLSEGTNNLLPNTYYKGGTLTNVTINLSTNNIDETIVNEYIFEFRSSSSTTLTMPSNIMWANDTPPEIVAGNIYQVSIINNFATYIQSTIIE